MEFEDIVADLLSNEGYATTKGKRRKDGGVDIYAEKNMPRVGRILTVWQAKHYNISNKVGLGIIRELADTRNELDASKGIIVTSSFLTKGAIERITRDKYLLEKVDRKDLLDWIIQSRT